MGHAKKGSSALKRPKVTKAMAKKRFSSESHSYDFRKHRGGRKSKNA